MTTSLVSTENEIKSWLKVILKHEELEDLSIVNEGNMEKGSGYTGDIFFLKVNGVTKYKVKKRYDLALKCASRNKTFRSKFPVRCAFLNEKYVYETILPYFKQFQIEKSVEEPFDKVAKCYGTLLEDELEVIVFDNLTAKGYTLWDKKKPLNRQYVEMIIRQYAKLHAISMAIEDQKSEKFQELVTKGLDDYLGKIYEYTDLISSHEELVDEIYDVLKGELDDHILSKWKHLKPKLRPFITKFNKGFEGMNVIIHGDCWVRNFMFQDKDGKSADFAFLDWQNSKLSNPVIDLSYFLFSCIGPDDIHDIHTILQLYYNSLTRYIQKLGSNPDRIYSFDQLLKDWKQYCTFGIILGCLIHKISSTSEDDVPDLVQAAEDGDVADSVTVPVKDVTAFRKRIHYIVKYVVEQDLI